ncbi:hypothetical protein LTR56_020497 [Elasticomyces elasticus]|nr:hypothetical protein LTR56_020497 [Elasticomyces elasticus]KAK3642728.1 hypothetical protein LTR22_015983 [Elasticomyces elasticus]KAK4910179.1 hypothetical protein LTR49_021145 [Elasticomyces elasticus]KAK5766388.1 hypothetical protein LTS12_003305 [Elasticomyces elasticus]
MATIERLKKAPKQEIETNAPIYTKPLTDSQYDAGFDLLTQGNRTTYQDFIIPQLSRILVSLLKTRTHVSVLEIGPGPRSVLGLLPEQLRQKVRRYTALEPNEIFAERLEAQRTLPGLEHPHSIHRAAFGFENDTNASCGADAGWMAEQYDLVLFCHSMYGMKPQRKFIECALERLSLLPEGGMVVVFHRQGTFHVDGFVCNTTTSFPTGSVCVADDDTLLDCFATFISGVSAPEMTTGSARREVCRALGRRDEAHPEHLFFGAPEVMVTFTRHATTLPELTAQMPITIDTSKIKNRQARLHGPAAVVRPTEILHVQQCVLWALKHKTSLTVVGGGHSGQCLWLGVVAVDMSAFDQLQIVDAADQEGMFGAGALVVVGTGCKAGDVVEKTMAAGFAVPMGSRPSVGAGLWLQGGIGHLARLHGLTSDSIVGATVVSTLGEILCIGSVPEQSRPAGAVRPDNEEELLWALKGAGTNFGIVISLVFKAVAAPEYTIRNWLAPLRDSVEMRDKFSKLELIAKRLPRHCSVDAYMFWDTDKLRLGVSMCEVSTPHDRETLSPDYADLCEFMGQEETSKVVDGVELFDTEMYMSVMHGGHGGGKTSAFTRCVFLKHIGSPGIVDILVAAMATRPSPYCYFHLLHGGGAVGDVADMSTAFGCRDWEYACVITGVWPRDQDGTEIADAAVQWVYKVAMDLLPVSQGAYCADLGPDPRDADLAVEAFGPNKSRLVRLKHSSDPENVLAYACPMPRTIAAPKLIVLVTGESCAGKDCSAERWTHTFRTNDLSARVVSISERTKREYSEALGADLARLLKDRPYKEDHRRALTTYYQDQVKQTPRLPDEHFQQLVDDAVGVDVLLITGMRDDAPVASFSHLAPGSRVVEVRVLASREVRQGRGAIHVAYGSNGDADLERESAACPTFLFSNEVPGSEAANTFATTHLMPFFHEDLQSLTSMMRTVPNFPGAGIDFRDVLDIVQQPDGLRLCTSLLQTHFIGNMARADCIAACEVGGLVFASALAQQVNVPLKVLRKQGKRPPPTISVAKPTSHISSFADGAAEESRIEMDKFAITGRATSVVIVDDTLATGTTLCAVLNLLLEAGVDVEAMSVVVVAEFPAHRGRELLRREGFGGVRVQSLLVFGGA